VFSSPRPSSKTAIRRYHTDVLLASHINLLSRRGQGPSLLPTRSQLFFSQKELSTTFDSGRHQQDLTHIPSTLIDHRLSPLLLARTDLPLASHSFLFLFTGGAVTAQDAFQPRSSTPPRDVNANTEGLSKEESKERVPKGSCSEIGLTR